MSARPNDTSPATARPSEQQLDRLMHEALVGAGSSVWSWDIEPDVLGGIDGAVALLGHPPGELPRTQAAWNALIHPDDLAGIDLAYDRHAAGDSEGYECEYRARTHAGGWRWLAERGRIVEWWPDGRPRRMVGTLSDVTRRREAEGHALEAGLRLKQIASHVPGVLYQFHRGPGSRGHFPYVSERCEAVLGVSADALMRDAGQLFDRIHPDDHDRMARITADSAQELTPWHCEFRLRLPGSGWRWLVGDSSPRQAPGGAVVWHGYMQDVTELRELEHARETAAAADAANRAKTEFLSRMSHEFRTPLNAVLGFAQLMELDPNDPLSPAQRQRMALIRESGQHLLNMIGDLLDHAKLEAAHLSVDCIAVPLAPLLQGCVAMMAPQAQTHGIDLRLAPVDSEAAALADPTRLRQVMLNLLSNAIKYNRPQGMVEVSTEIHGSTCAVHVRDSGVGIPVEHQARLFEPFNRLAQTHSGIEGAGMGLAITRSLVELMRGRVGVRSQPGVGSTFSVWLPAPAPAPRGGGAGQSTSLPT